MTPFIFALMAGNTSYNGGPLTGVLATNGDLTVGVVMTIFFLVALCGIPVYITLFHGRSLSRSHLKLVAPFDETVPANRSERGRTDRAA